MTPQFVTLKSGCRINVAHIVQYSAFLPNPEKLWIEVSSGVEGENEKVEDMTATDLDALLSASSSPIVSPVLELRIPNIGDAVMFDWHGTNRHGVVFAHHEDDQKLVITSHGEDYQYDLPTGYIIKIQ